MSTLDEIMAKATKVERVVNVCVAGATAGEYERVRTELANLAELPTSGRLSGNTRYAELSAELDRLSEEMSAATYAFRFRALSPKAWDDLLITHADPEGMKLFNTETFPAAAIAATCVEPEGLEDLEKVNDLLENLSPAQQADLFDGAWDVNTTAPKGLISSAASAAPQDSEKN